MGLTSSSGRKMILWNSRLRLGVAAMRLANRLVPNRRENCVPGSRKPCGAIRIIEWGKDIAFILKKISLTLLFFVAISLYFHSWPALKKVAVHSLIPCVTIYLLFTPHSMPLTPHSVDSALLSNHTWNPFYPRSTILWTPPLRRRKLPKLPL